jgi:hypothetical protein
LIQGSGQWSAKWALRLLREQFIGHSQAIQTIETESTQIEHRLSDLVNQACELTSEEEAASFDRHRTSCLKLVGKRFDVFESDLAQWAFL